MAHTLPRAGCPVIQVRSGEAGHSFDHSTILWDHPDNLHRSPGGAGQRLSSGGRKRTGTGMHKTLFASLAAATSAELVANKVKDLQQRVYVLENRIQQVEHKSGLKLNQAARAATEHPQAGYRKMRAVVSSDHPLFQHIHEAISRSQVAVEASGTAAAQVQTLEEEVQALTHRVHKLEQLGMTQHQVD